MMKKFTPRERVLLVVLGLLIVFCVYYFLFYTPVTSSISGFDQESAALDAQIAEADAKVTRMNQMKAELEQIVASEGELKELPAYDNRSNVMNSLSTILADALQYNVSFSTVDEEDSTVRRNISISYTCSDLSTAKTILKNINDGEYPCLIKNCSISDSGNACSVSVELTYFEYK